MANEYVLFEEHKEDLRKSGLNEATIREAKLFSQKALGNLAKKGVKSVLVFPYYNITSGNSPYVTTESEFKRVKLFPPYKDGNGNLVKYLVKKGSKNRLYITKLASQVREDTATPLYITEGEKKALALSQNGLHGIGLSGLWSWKNKGSEDLIADFDRFEWFKRVIYLIPDNDFEHERHNHRLRIAVYQLALKLINSGAQVFLIRLPQGEAKGVDDFLCKNTVDDFIELRDKAEEMLKEQCPSRNEPPIDLLRLPEEELDDYLIKAKPPEYLNKHKGKELFYFSLVLAKRLGLVEAVVLQKIHDWLKFNYKRHPKMVKNGRTWVFRGYTGLKREIPCFGLNTIRRAIKKLEGLKILIAGNHSERLGDRTKWYTIDYIKLLQYLSDDD